MSKSSNTTKVVKLAPIHPGKILLEDLRDEESASTDSHRRFVFRRIASA